MKGLFLPAILLGLGIAALIVAPLAQICNVNGDSSACETAGTIVLNVVGGGLIAGGGILAALQGRHKIAA
jgi:hypothetical protein